MIYRHHGLRYGTAAAAAMGLAALVLMGSASRAAAQSAVTVDLSVIEDSGRFSGGVSAAASGQLKLPPRTAPTSILHVAPKTRVKLRQPASREAVKKAMAKPAPAMAKKPMKKAPAPTAMAKPAKPQIAKAPPKMSAAPKPTVKTETAAATLPPPPPSAKAPVALAAKTTAAPPPPPAVSTTPPPMTASATTATPLPAAPAAIELKAGRALSIPFDGANTKLSEANKPGLLKLVRAVRGNKDFRLQVKAFASGADLSTSKARRMSLERALNVRTFLIDNGVRSTQIDVHALGNKAPSKPANRVDINLAQR